MTLSLAILFWLAAALVFYAYAAYPLILLVTARLFSRPIHRAPFSGTVSITVCAHNEASRIAARRDELLALLRTAKIPGEIIIVSDGSSDQTAHVARVAPGDPVRVIELQENLGKAQALNHAAAASAADVLVFADARQHWADDALIRLLENFADPSIGGVSGDLQLESADGGNAGVGVYWRYEKAIRKMESRLHSCAGATGAISAVRRELFRPIPPRTILDDVYWPLNVVLQGRRVIHDPRALAFDRLPAKPRDEFRRKVRTLSGNFQLVIRMPRLLFPWTNPIWFQFFSHKLLRLAVPWSLLAMLLCSALLATPLYWTLFFCQLAGYLLALIGISRTISARLRLASAASSFVVLNTAAWVAFWVWITGRSAASWNKTLYAQTSEQA